MAPGCEFSLDVSKIGLGCFIEDSDAKKWRLGLLLLAGV